MQRPQSAQSRGCACPASDSPGEDLIVQAPFAISVVRGPEHEFVLANPHYERMVGRRGLVGRTLRDVFPELATDSPVLRMLDQVRATGVAFTTHEFAAEIDFEGRREQRYFQFTCTPARDDTIQTVAVDVTEQVCCRKRAEAMAEALRVNERRFQATFENAAVGIAHVSLAGQWLRFNDRVAELLGYSRADLERLRFQDVTHPEDLARDMALAESLRRGEIRSYQLEKRYVKQDGSVFWAMLTGSLVTDEAGEPEFFVAVIEDISDRKAAENALRAADRQKDEFLAMLSHELRNPLAAIRSACALLESLHSSDPIVTRTQTILSRQTNHMAHLLDELLDLARVTNGKLTIVPTLIDLGQLTRDAIADIELIANSPSLSVELPDEPLWVDGDSVRLSQVVHNLLGNAIKYTAADGRVSLELVREGEAARLRVRDTGVGFDDELAAQLFKPFQQAPQDIARSAGGLGLGLALAKTIVDLHHGSIAARSPGPGRGSTFEVRIPLSQTVPLPADQAPGPESRPARVMIVEDNEDAAELLGALLRARQFEVELATGGGQAIALARSWRPDAVICDIGLPDVDGYTVARTLRAEPELAGIKLVALSGYGQAKDRVKAAEAGFDQHLTKPAAIDAVVRAIVG